jgi:serine/threonine protein kinase
MQAMATRYSRGTSSYRAPEMLRETSTFNNKVDIWALGCVFYELVYLTKAFKDDFAVREQNGEDFAIPTESLMITNVDWLEVIGIAIKEMLKQESSQRPTAKDILNRLGRARRAAYPYAHFVDYGMQTDYNTLSMPQPEVVVSLSEAISVVAPVVSAVFTWQIIVILLYEGVQDDSISGTMYWSVHILFIVVMMIWRWLRPKEGDDWSH